jgi:hypothetical protein
VPRRPSDNEFAPYYLRYVSLVPETEIVEALEKQIAELRRVAAAISPDREHFRYADGKWSIREVFGHMIDAERIFGVRAFCFSRGETAPLPSFDENQYVARSAYDNTPLAELLDEFAALRAAHLAVLRRLNGPAWDQTGTASGNPVTVRGLAYIMVGHVRHHLSILADRYGIR